MKVLVTGADGFIGSHLVERLLSEGHVVRAFCLYTSTGSWGWLDSKRGTPGLEVMLGDIRDARLVEEACRGVDYVFHLAALIAIPYSYQAPESYLDVNVRGTLNVLEGARRAKVTRVVHTSTSEVYGTPEVLPITESHPLKAQSPYAATKIAADQLALSYYRSFDVPVTVLRPFNTYGPRQSTRAVIPAILTQLLEGKQVRLGRMDTRRDMTFVADTVDGFVRAMTAPGIEGQAIHLGTGRSYSVGEIFAAACDLMGVNLVAMSVPERLRPELSEVEVLESDPTRAREVLGWEAKTSLEEGLRMTATWLRPLCKEAELSRAVV